MSAILSIDETSGVQNVQGSLITNDISLGDIPTEFSSELAGAVPIGQSATPVGLARSGNGTATTTDDLIQSFGGNVSEVAFTINGGDGADSGLTTVGGRMVHLYLDTTNNNVVYGREAGGTGTTPNASGRIVFALFLDTMTAAAGDAGSTGARLWLAQYLPMYHPDEGNPNDIVTLAGKLKVAVNTLVNFSLEGAPSGQNLFLMFGDGTPTLDDTTIVVTGKPGNTVNTGQGGGMTTIGTNNQMIDPGEGMYFTFVKGANPLYTVPNLDQTEADVAGNIDFQTYFGATSASFGVVQLQPPKGGTLLITAILNAGTSEKGETYIDGLAHIPAEEVDIVSVTVTRMVKVGKNLVETNYVFSADTPATQGGITVDLSGKTAKVTGVLTGDRVKYTTPTDHNRVLIDNVGHSNAQLNSAFDIGGFRLESGSLTSTPLGDVAIVDDAPSAAAVLDTGAVSHDETAGVQTDAQDVAIAIGAFAGVSDPSTGIGPGYASGTAAVINAGTSAGGVDGIKTTTFSLNVSAEGVDSGLDSVEGRDILLTKEGDLVVGRISGGLHDGKAAFAVAINSSTGVLSMVQYHAIKHPTGGASSPDESLSVANTALLAIATVTDGDDDPSSTSVPIGARVSIQDDGPSASATLGAGMVIHDETAGVALDPGANDEPGPLTQFNGVSNISSDMAAGYAQGTAAVINSGSSSGGSDGLASTVYSLRVSAAGVDSGLDTTEGNNILLTEENGLVVGRISGGDNNGKAAFAVAIDASTGVLSMVQYHSIKHPTGGTSSPDESVAVTNAALLAVATVTDGDGDTSTASVPIGAQVRIQDDAPSAAAALGAGAVAHDETAGVQTDANDTAGAIGAFSGISMVSSDMTPGYATGTAAVIDPSASTGGVDGIASTIYSLDVSALGGVDSGLDTTEGADILLFKEGSLVVGRISGGGNNGKAAFAVSIDSGTGVLSMVQYHSILHPTGGAANPDEPLSIANGALLATATVTDGDGDTSAVSVAIGARVSIQDDGPTAAAALGAGGVAHDETVGLDGDANDIAGAVAALSGVTTLSTDMTPAYATGTASVIDSTASTGGVDGLAGTVYSLDVLSEGVDSGLDTTQGEDIVLTKVGSIVVGRISGGANNGKAAFAVSIDSATGILSMVQYNSVKHPTGGAASPDESVAITAGALLALATVTDGDGDTSTTSVGIGARVQFQDDGPAIVGVSDLVYANSSNPSPGGTGIFDFTIGVDDHKAPFSSSNSDFSGVSLVSGSVGVTAISNRSVNWASETLTEAVFNVSFDYISNPGLNTTTTATGTLTFDKDAGTYTLAMSAPIQSFTVLTTSNATQFIGYVQGENSFTLDNTQPAVSVAQLASNFFVQFSGYTEPGGGTGSNNLRAGDNGANNDNTFVNGELFNQAADWVSISGIAAGVAGDTLQKGEVLDMDFFEDNPGGDTVDDPTASAAGIFLKFDGINSEDLVVVLKLANASDPNLEIVTTKAFVVDNADIYRAGSTLPAGYNITLDNNDGTVIFEGNDFNGEGENYVVVGAQVLVSTEGITGSGINLNPATGAAGGSSGTQNFGAATTDNDVVKISDIGFLTTVTPDSHLVFNAAVIDADGDATAAQVLDVTIISGSVFAAGSDRESIQGRSDFADTFVFDSLLDSPASLHDIISGFTSGSDKIDLSAIDASTGGGANDAFVFIGSADFSAAGQLRFDAATHTLQGDLDGNGAADLVIELAGVSSIVAGDIVL